MIPRKYRELVFWVLTAFVMSMIMSLFMTVVNVWFPAHLLSMWIKSWMIAFVAVFILSAIILPQLKKITEKITY